MMFPLFLPVDEWLRALSPPIDTAVRGTFEDLYGQEPGVWNERGRLFREALGAYREHYGSGPVLISRSPARLSFNPHSDHQGSFVLYGCHGREITVISGWRDDDRFRLANTAAEFASGLEFDLEREIARSPAAWNRGWVEYIDSPEVKAIVNQTKDRRGQSAGKTGTLNYVKGAVLRLAHACPGAMDHGLNLLVAGDIHYGAGQSSSSAIVVAIALALNAIYHLGFDRKELVRLLGEAEWYVGTRGGSGDQAAMLLGQRGKLSNIQFIPPLRFRDLRTVEFPEGYQVLIANSGMRAEKSSAQKRKFNTGVFAYKFAYAEMHRALVEHHVAWGIPNELIEGTHWLADFNTERLALGRIYQLLGTLEQDCPMARIRERYPDQFEQLAQSFFDTTNLADLPPSVPLRGAAVYGIGRADRGMMQDRLLAVGDEPSMLEFGLLASITHDGDRLFQMNGQRVPEPYRGHHDQLTDAHLARLAEISDQGRGGPEWEQAQLRRQPGFYGASVRQLDTIVDLVKPLDGVLGAGLMGAGGGGVVLIIARDGEDVEQRVLTELTEHYFGPEGIAPDVEKWCPSHGASVLSLAGNTPLDISSTMGPQGD